MAIRYDITVDDAQVVTRGTQHILAVEFDEKDDRAFTVSAVTLSIFDEEGVSAGVTLQNISGTFAAGLKPGSVEVRATLTAAMLNTLADGTYYGIWSITLSDQQTRRAKQALEVRTVE